MAVHGNCPGHAELLQVNFLRIAEVLSIQCDLRRVFIEAEEVTVHRLDGVLTMLDVMTRLVDDHISRIDAQLQGFCLLENTFSKEIVNDLLPRELLPALQQPLFTMNVHLDSFHF